MPELGRAPIYHRRWEQRRWVPERLPDPEHRKWIGLLLQDPFPFNIPIFDTSDNELQLPNNALQPMASLENRIILAEDWWWYGVTASFTPPTGGSVSSFSWQLYHTVNYGTENEVGYQHQQKPVSNGNFFGTGQKPFYLKVPKLFRRNTELICKVSNDSTSNNIIQIVMLGYLGEPAGGLS
jgi:hypothetical protein